MPDGPAARPPIDAQVAKLIELGRDREAAALAVAGSADQIIPPTSGDHMHPLDQLDQLGPLLGAVVANISPEQLDAPTPCANFTITGVLDHMIGGATAFAAAFRGQEPAAPPAGDVLEGFGPALTDLAMAMHEPGALDRTIQAPFGEVSGETFARFVVLDGLVHGWDLSTASGQPYDPPAELVAEVAAFARGALDPLRDGDTFKAATDPPAGATALEQVVAYTGRDVTR